MKPDIEKYVKEELTKEKNKKNAILESIKVLLPEKDKLLLDKHTEDLENCFLLRTTNYKKGQEIDEVYSFGKAFKDMKEKTAEHVMFDIYIPINQEQFFKFTKSYILV